MARSGAPSSAVHSPYPQQQDRAVRQDLPVPQLGHLQLCPWGWRDALLHVRPQLSLLSAPPDALTCQQAQGLMCRADA